MSCQPRWLHSSRSFRPPRMSAMARAKVRLFGLSGCSGLGASSVLVAGTAVEPTFRLVRPNQPPTWALATIGPDLLTQLLPIFTVGLSTVKNRATEKLVHARKIALASCLLSIEIARK